MWRGVLVVLLCALSVMPGVALAEVIEGGNVERVFSDSQCPQVNRNTGPQDAGGWWTSVCLPRVVSEEGVADVRISNPTQSAATMQAYEVAFPERFGSNNGAEPGEFMVVVVKQGAFSLDLRGNDSAEVLVTSPPGKKVKVLQPNNSNSPKEEGAALTYTIMNDTESLVCELGCRIDQQQPVLLEEGYTAILKEGTLCLICLLGRITADQQFEDSPGVLVVYALLQDEDPSSFSWVRTWKEADLGVSATSNHTQSRFAWAFNPGNSRCGGGH